MVLALINVGYYFNAFYTYYPKYSADFWGWQYGAGDIMGYFKENAKKYDELYMEGSFNAPAIFLKFYDPEKNCPNCAIGGIEKFNTAKKQLFAVSRGTLPSIGMKYTIKKTLQYPDGSNAFYIIEFI